MALYQYHEVRKVHLELSSLCNAECPLCPRNLFGYPYNDGYVEKHLTLTEVKKIFPTDFLNQLHEILINGNFGDLVMNPESLDIIEFFHRQNPSIKINISTNGGARNQNFWKELVQYNTHIFFCIEGLEDTHSLYRKNTVFSTVLHNAKTYIDAGGQATWKMLIFDHNRHQIDQCRQLSKELGFKQFLPQETGRNSGPVYDHNGNYIYSIGKVEFKQPAKINPLINQKQQEHTLTNIRSEIKRIDCGVIKDRSIYISSTGEVYPCCYLGFQPDTFGHGNYMQISNKQLAKLIKENNALEYGIEHSIKWFNGVSESWDKPTFEQGRLVHCNDSCGRCD